MDIDRKRCELTARNGFSLLEIVFGLVAIVVLVALAAPAIVRSRESARSSACMSNQLQIAQAILAYESYFHVLPVGASEADKQSNQRFGVIPAILPLLNESAVADQIDWHTTLIASGTKSPVSNGPNVLRCPADNISIVDKSSNNYVANAGSDAMMSNAGQGSVKFLGAFDFGKAVSLADFTDGVANTALMGERLVGSQRANSDAINTRVEMGKYPRDIADITGTTIGPGQPDEFANACAQIKPEHRGWIADFGRSWIAESHYVHVLTPNSTVFDCGYSSTYPLAGAISARSFHPGHIVLSFADERIERVSNEIDLTIWRAMGTRSGDK